MPGAAWGRRPARSQVDNGGRDSLPHVTFRDNVSDMAHTDTAHTTYRPNEGTAAVPTTKVTGLTKLNTDALREHWRNDRCHAEIRATVVTFHADPARALEMVIDLANELAVVHGRTGHPVQSLPAVSRKLAAWIDAQD